MRRLALMGLPTYLLLVALTASTVRGAECEDHSPVAAFSPGEWIARGIQIYREAPDDGLSTVYVAGTGGFNLNIDGSGNASGLFHLDGTATVQASNAGDDGYLDVQWKIDGDLHGTGLRIVVDGTESYRFSGAVDSNPSGDGDEWSGSGNDLWGFGNTTEQDYRSAFSPSDANCNQVFGSLDGPVQYGGSGQSAAYFLAVRVPGSSMPEIDIEQELVDLLEAAETVLTMNPLDTDALAQFVVDVMAFSSLIASLEHCDFAETRAGPAWEMLRRVLIETADRLLAAATAGAYETVDVIDAMATILQGGVLGWRGHDCLEPTDGDDAAVLFTRFEDLLLQRLEQTLLMENWVERMAEVKVIAGAAYQFGMDRVIAYLEEEASFPEPGEGSDDATPEEVVPDAS